MANPVTVDLEKARKVLASAWGQIKASSRPPGLMQKHIEAIMAASDVTFKYILLTGFLAKATNPDVHARALQAGSHLSGAYDARSVCHQVVVGFEKSKGNLLGLSNEPFVNKPARHAEHDGNNPQLRNKLGARTLHAALELAQTSSAGDVFKGLVHILRLGSEKAAKEIEVEVAEHTTAEDLLTFVKEFLGETDGGARLAAIWGAFTALLSEHGNVSVQPPSASDQFTKTVGDVEVRYDDELVSAAECKQRPLNLDDVKHGIRKAEQRGVPEYLFVVSAGLQDGQEREIFEELHRRRTVEVTLINIWDESPLLATLLNPARRSKFAQAVVEALKRMRKFDTANTAADLWNRITE